METTVDLKRLTVPEKLHLMEALWTELSQQEHEVPIPDWHKEILEERERQMEAGKVQVIDWEVAKNRIATRTR